MLEFFGWLVTGHVFSCVFPRRPELIRVEGWFNDSLSLTYPLGRH